MSYDIELTDPLDGSVLEADKPHFMRGGTYSMGNRKLWLNVTYNYAPHYYRVFGGKGIRQIYGMTGAASIPILQAAVAQLKDDYDDDYWMPTEGNAKLPLVQLITMAGMRPDGVWRGD